jgi:hypothetical protein
VAARKEKLGSKRGKGERERRTPGCTGTGKQREGQCRRVETERRNATHHKRLEIRTPELGDGIGNLPVLRRPKRPIHRDLPLRLCLRTQSLVQTRLQPLNVRLTRLEVVSRQLEEARSDLKEEDVRVTVFVDDHETLCGAAHAELLVVGLAEGGRRISDESFSTRKER